MSNINKPKNRYAVNISLAIILAGVIIPSNIVLDAVAESTFSVTPIYLGTHHVPEGSGVAASRTYPGIFWMISDSGNPAHLYAVDQSGATKRVFDVSGSANIDWEDIAIDESGRIWIGDIGDNGGGRSSYVVYRMNEPNPYGSATSVSATAYKFVYPNGSHDAEALFIWQNTPYVVQKRGVSEVYAFPTLDSSRTVTLKYVGTFKDGQMIGGADISADGRRLALINDQYNYHWIIERSASSTNIADFFNSPTKQWRINFPNQQGEAIGFLPQSYSFVVASEQGGFWKVDKGMYDSTSNPPTTPAPTSGKYTLEWGSYDYDNAGEVTVLLNGHEVATLPQKETPSNSGVWVHITLDISPYIVSGENLITFRQNIYSSGVRNLEVNGPNGVIYSDSTTRWQWDGGQKYLTYKMYGIVVDSSTTPAPTSGKYTLEWGSYDYDNAGEVTVLLNGHEVATLPQKETPSNSGVWVHITLDISPYIVSGENLITFRQNIYSSGVRNLEVNGPNGVIYSDSTTRWQWDGGQKYLTYKINVNG